MNIILFGGTGMIGSAVLAECLEDPRVERVLSVGRRPVGVGHPKLSELILSDLFDYEAYRDRLTGYDGCLFCLGVTAVGKNEAEYRRLTFDLTLAAARPLVDLNPGMTFCYVSGEGTNRGGRAMWARVKGETEDALMELPFEAVYLFRPGYVHPERGVESKTRVYRAIYAVFTPLYPVLRRVFPGFVTTSGILARAMIEAVAGGYEKNVLRSRDFQVLAARDQFAL